MSETAIIADLPPEAATELYEGPLLDLPPGAEQNSDGSVTLTLAYPKKLTITTGPNATVLPIDTLTFFRMTGAEARKIISAKDTSVAGFAASTRMKPARASLIINAMDAADGMAASQVVSELLGGGGAGLTENAVSTPDGVTLTLLFPTEDEAGTEHTVLFFPRMTVGQRNKAQAQPDILDYLTANATGLTPKQAHDLLDKMDGADTRSVNNVIRFLFGLGR